LIRPSNGELTYLRISSPTLLLSESTPSFDGVICSLLPVLRKLCPRNVNPCVMCVILVFSSDKVRPRSSRNCSMAGLTTSSKRRLDLPVTMKSSAYRTKLTLVRRGTALRTTCSRPSSVKFARVGLIIPPYAK